MTSITLDNVKKAYGDTVIMDKMNFTVNSGERLVLLGPSGCGKSTILRMIAGFEEITDGQMKFDDKVVNKVPVGDRNIAMVFQNYALYPHMKVKENILYGLKVNKVPESQYRDRYNEVINVLDLEKYLDRKPAELSGGQRQRVALARATVKDTNIFLLDEPLSNLDAKLRVSARESLARIHERYGQTMIYVTHDQIEAMTFGHRIALLNFGELQMIDTPENIYHKPANIFTAKFIGNPPMNVPKNTKYQDGQIVLHESRVQLDPVWTEYINQHASKNLLFGIRPEDIIIHHDEQANTIKGQVINVENQGPAYANFIQIGEDRMIVMTEQRAFTVAQEAYLELNQNALSFFDKDTTQNIGYPQEIETMKERNAGKLNF